MFKFKLIVLVAVLLSGCTSSSDHMKMANDHAKTGSYNQSIGQSHSAQKEFEAAEKHKKAAVKPESIISELLGLFFSSD